MYIEVTQKNIYGNNLVYPKCPTATAFSMIAKTKTLSIENLKTIKAMGYEIRVVNENILEGI
jgi:hypothetical protein